MKPTLLDRNDTRRNEVISLVRRRLAAGKLTKGEIDSYKQELGADAVDAIVVEFAPKKTPKTDAPKTE